MRRLLFVLVLLIAFGRWRTRRFEACDRAGGFGAYSPVIPARKLSTP